ncbi:MAG: sensor protein [Gemmatimonadetes bacterium]|nr:sensor protein [Gemmatimonadota bacterium]
MVTAAGNATRAWDERRFRRLVEVAHVGIWVVDANARTTFANARAIELLGLPGLAGLIGRTLFEFVGPDAEFDTRTRFTRWQRGVPETWELRLARADGTQIWVQMTATADHDGDGPIGGASLVFSDITDRRLRDENAHVANEMFRGMTEQSITGKYLVRDGQFMYVNPKMADIFGYTVDEMLALPDTMMLAHPDDRPIVAEMISERMNGAEHVHFCFRGLRKDDRIIFCEVYGSRVMYRHGPALLGAVLDVTDRVEAEQASRIAQQEFTSLTHMAPIGIFRCTTDGETTSVNPEVARIFGCGEQHILGHQWLTYVHEADRARVLDEWARAVERNEAYTTDYRITRPDGAERVVHVHCVPIADESGDPVGAVGTVDDVTERQALEERSRQTQKMEAVGQLAGGMAHDFNNLLTAISGYAELLERQMSGNSAAIDDLTAIREAAAKGAALTRRLLSFSRKQVLRESLVDVNVVVAGADALLRRLIGEDVRVETVLASLPKPVLVDAMQLEQVLINLAVNARDAMPGGGRLSIRSNYHASLSPEQRTALGLGEGDFISIAVDDTGFGMDVATRRRVFEPFFTTKEPGKGTGLGLATVYGIVRAASGAVQVESEPGRGSRFTVFLPAVEGEASNAADVPALRRRRGTETILLVEDEPKLREIIRRVLVDSGYEVTEAVNGGDALVLITRDGRTFDLVLSDVVMPGLSGGALLRELEQFGYAGRVMLMSGYAEDNAQLRDALRAGTTLLEKPFTPEQLARQVRAVLDAV